MERDEMLASLKNKLTPKRYVHSIGVEYTAACMAFVYGEDVQRARIAGLLHDCAKCLSASDKLKKAEKFEIPISKCERENPDLLHGKLGAYYAKKKYGVTDEKIIFVADFIEPNRKMIRELPEIRKEAFTDLDTCIIHILRRTLEYLEVKGCAVDDLTEKTYEYYRSQA